MLQPLEHIIARLDDIVSELTKIARENPSRQRSIIRARDLIPEIQEILEEV